MNSKDIDNKSITTFSSSMMTSIITISMLYMLQRLFVPQQQVQIQPESYGIWYLGPAGHIMNVENGPDEEPLYMGEAVPGTLDSDPGWRIYRYDYIRDPVSGDMISGTIRYAGGSTAFDKVWDNRAEYEYS